jgi:hypothetical protein
MKANWTFYLILFCIQGAFIYLLQSGYIKNQNMIFSFLMAAMAGYRSSLFILSEKTTSLSSSKTPIFSTPSRSYLFRLFALFLPAAILTVAITIVIPGTNPDAVTSFPFMFLITIISEVIIGILYGLLGYWVLDSFSEVKSPFGLLFRENIRVFGKTIAWSIGFILLLLSVFLFVLFAQASPANLLLSGQARDEFRNLATIVFLSFIFIAWDLTVFSFQSLVIATYYRPLYLSKLAIPVQESEVDQREPGPAQETQP